MKQILLTLILIGSVQSRAGDLYISDDEQPHINATCELYQSGKLTDAEIDAIQAQLDQAASSDGSYEIQLHELCEI